VPCGPVNDIAGAFAMAGELGLNARVTVGAAQDSVDLAANPITLSDTPATYLRRPPRLGEHADEVRAWLQRPAADEPLQHHHTNQPMGAHP
jgi:crotonobetainyl-CoA:carnitine CoA-transferase CaiB-like acyl-CoA transferase